jgi:hypothetical protein
VGLIPIRRHRQRFILTSIYQAVENAFKYPFSSYWRKPVSRPEWHLLPDQEA